ILWQGVGQFHISATGMVAVISVWARHPKWEDGVTPVWLWLEWVRVEGGGIVLHVEIMQPIKIAQHKNRPESPGAPFTCIAVDSRGAFFKSATRGKQMAVMFKIVYTYFESAASELFS